jgi:hypothetical protein
LCLAVVEKIEKWRRIPEDDVRDVIGVKLVDLTNHGDTLMTTGPINSLDILINLLKQLLIHVLGVY